MHANIVISVRTGNHFTQIPSAFVVSFLPTSSEGYAISWIYRVPTIVSMLFSTMLIMVDFIIACVTNKKVRC